MVAGQWKFKKKQKRLVRLKGEKHRRAGKNLKKAKKVKGHKAELKRELEKQRKREEKRREDERAKRALENLLKPPAPRRYYD